MRPGVMGTGLWWGCWEQEKGGQIYLGETCCLCPKSGEKGVHEGFCSGSE